MASPGSIGSAMPDSEDTQVRRVADLERFVKELGPSVARSLATTVTTLRDLVAQVTATLADINATVAAAITANSMTTAAIQNLVAHPGAVTATGIVTADAGLSSLDVRNRLLSSGYVSVYADSTGRLGYVPSSLKVKTITKAYTADLEDWLAVAPQVFYYNDDDERTPRVGFIAEWVNKHFPEFVVHDNVEGEEGTHPAGLHYEFMIAGMQSAFRQFVTQQRAETNALKARLDALEA